MSQEISIRSICLPLLSVLVLVLAPTDSFGARVISAGEASGDDYRDQVLGSGHAEGDIWGGEQGSDPTISPVGPVVSESMPIINTTPGSTTAPDPRPKPRPRHRGGHAGWIAQLASFLDWLLTSPWTSSPR
jgi:hypothetical protein